MKIVFTGHRNINRQYPRDYTALGADATWAPVCEAVRKLVSWLISKRQVNPNHLILSNGGAMGWDLATFFYVVRDWMALGANYHLYLPWPGYWNHRWNRLPGYVQQQVRVAYSAATEEHYGQAEDDGDWRTALLRRNQLMVQGMTDGDVMIALWDGYRKGGTWATVSGALNYQHGLFQTDTKIYVIDPHSADTGIITSGGHDEPIEVEMLKTLRRTCTCGSLQYTPRAEGDHRPCANCGM